MEDFMEVKVVTLTNALNPSLLMINFSQVMLHQFRHTLPENSIQSESLISNCKML